MNEIKDYAKSISVPFDHNVEVRFFKANPTRALYTIMKSPPDNMAFMAETDVISISKAGFIGELIILLLQVKVFQHVSDIINYLSLETHASFTIT